MVLKGPIKEDKVSRNENISFKQKCGTVTFGYMVEIKLNEIDLI